MTTQWHAWLPFLAQDVPTTLTQPREIAAFELEQALPLLAPQFVFHPASR